MGKKAFQWQRRITQGASLILLGEFSFYGLFRCPFAVPYVSCGNCPVIQCPGRKLWLAFWILLPLSAIILGRAFCGWTCPAGLVSELLGKVSLLRNKIKGTWENLFSAGKYLLLAASLAVFFILNNPRWAVPMRTGDFFDSVSLTFEHAHSFWLARSFFIVSGLALAILIPAFWCRYLCPTGGFLELFRKTALVKYVRTQDCCDCGKCRTVCPLETRPLECNCTNCGACKTICPLGAIKAGWKTTKPQRTQRTRNKIHNLDAGS